MRVDARRVFKVEKVGVVIGSECEEVVAMLGGGRQTGAVGPARNRRPLLRGFEV